VLVLAPAVLVACGGPTVPSPPGAGLSVPSTSRPWSTGYAEGKAITTTHYHIYTTLLDPDRQELLPGFLEASHANTLRLTGLENAPGERMTVYMLGTRREWAALTDSRFGRHSAPSLMIENGAYTVEGVIVCWDIGRTATFAVASHEGMHQVLHHQLEAPLPLWAEEGLATTAEAFVVQNRRVRFTPEKNIARLNDLREGIIHGHWLDMPTLLSATTLDLARKGQRATLSYYGQLYALMHFLRNSPAYRSKWRTLFGDARSGRLAERVPEKAKGLRGMRWHRAVGKPIFRNYIHDDLAAFENDFRAYARRLVRLDG